jgi:hypothetical protein
MYRFSSVPEFGGCIRIFWKLIMQMGVSAFMSAALTCCCANAWAEFFASQPPHFSPTIAVIRRRPKLRPRGPYFHLGLMIPMRLVANRNVPRLSGHNVGVQPRLGKYLCCANSAQGVETTVIKS